MSVYSSDHCARGYSACSRNLKSMLTLSFWLYEREDFIANRKAEATVNRNVFTEYVFMHVAERSHDAPARQAIDSYRHTPE